MPIDALLFFINIPKMGCISGKDVPSLSIHMGAVGKPGGKFPDSGGSTVRNDAVWSGFDPCDSWGVLSLAEHDAQLSSHEQRGSVVGRVLGPCRRHNAGARPNVLLLPVFGSRNADRDHGHYCPYGVLSPRSLRKSSRLENASHSVYAGAVYDAIVPRYVYPSVYSAGG